MLRTTPVRVLLSAVAIAGATLAGPLITAGPAIAMSPCTSAAPPDWCFDPPAAPSAPTGLRATAILQTTVTLAWNQLRTVPLTLTRTAAGATTTLSLPARATGYTDTTPRPAPRSPTSCGAPPATPTAAPTAPPRP